MTTSATPHLFWITSRAAGIVALVLASLAVSLGLLMSTKLLRKPRPRPARRARGPVAVDDRGDRRPRRLAARRQVSAPVAGRHRDPVRQLLQDRLDFGSGSSPAGALALLGLSYYARRWIGAKRWRKLHRLTALMWLLGLVHALGEGTDAGQVWFLAMIAIVAVPALLLLATRLASSRPGRLSRRRGPDPRRRATRWPARAVGRQRPGRVRGRVGRAPAGVWGPAEAAQTRDSLQPRRVALDEARRTRRRPAPSACRSRPARPCRSASRPPSSRRGRRWRRS